ncbi:MAG: hypothetical protein LBU14_03450 [Candidatus Peribacteria bacterium]|nr:hypothetical protein [Candidatus Peribacteria bacterium]
MFHKLFFVDIIVFLCLVYSFIDLRFKNTFYIILAFILVFCNIFIAYKWFTKKRILYPKITFRLCYTVLVLLTIESIYFLIFDDVVAFIAINFCAPIIFL